MWCAGAMYATPGARALLGALLAALVALQVVALYVPMEQGGPPSVPHGDKVVHAVLFGAPVLVVGLAKGRSWPLVAALSVVHAPVSEVIQHVALPSRSGDVMDVVADVVGIGLALAGVGWSLRRPRRHRL